MRKSTRYLLGTLIALVWTTSFAGSITFVNGMGAGGKNHSREYSIKLRNLFTGEIEERKGYIPCPDYDKHYDTCKTPGKLTVSWDPKYGYEWHSLHGIQRTIKDKNCLFKGSNKDVTITITHGCAKRLLLALGNCEDGNIEKWTCQ